MNNSIKITLEVPLEIVTKKISKTKTDSIFYAGKDIARVRTKKYEYVLTTAGEYSFANKIQGEEIWNERSKVVKRLTDKRINWLNKQNLIGDWGWFGINVWEYEFDKWYCLDYPTDAYSRYDEALKAFKSFVKDHLKKQFAPKEKSHDRRHK